MRRLLGVLRVATLLTAALGIAGWAATPPAAWLAERSVAQTRVALDRALSDLDRGWLDRTVTAALDAQPPDWALIDSARAAAPGIAPSPDIAARLARAEARDRGALGLAANCAACAAGRPGCRMADGLVCALGVELTPAGDLRALARAAAARAMGRPVDRVDVALAGVGLGATALALGSGGAALAAKGGAALMRVARGAGRLTAGLEARLAHIGGALIRWQRLPRRPAAALDGAAWAAALHRPALAAGRALSADLGRLGRAVPPAHALALLGRVDTAAEARAMARLAEAGGVRTLAAVHRLGARPALRLTLRLSRTGRALAAIAAALAAQAMALAAALVLSAARRACAAPRLAPR